jgi:hypothetical protein
MTTIWNNASLLIMCPRSRRGIERSRFNWLAGISHQVNNDLQSR